MTSVVNFVATVALLSFGYLAHAASIHNVNQEPVVEMTEIGTIGNKTFYMTANETLTTAWMGAEGLCKYVNLELAILRNDEEFDFLIENTDASVKLWVGATMKGGVDNTREAFEWGDGSSLSISFFHHTPQLWICVYLSGDDHLYVDLCHNQHGVLCQSTA